MDDVYGSGKIRWITSIGTALLVTASGHALAASSSLSGGIDNRFTDNARRTPTNEQSDVETRVNLNIGYLSDPGKCTSAVNMALGYGYWHEDAFDSEVYTNGTLRGQCELAQGLVWQASNSISQVTRDNRQADTQDNLTRRNIFRTGPVYVLRLTQVDQLQFSAAYERTDFDETGQADSDRFTGTVAYNRTFSETFQSGVSVSAERTELDTGQELDRESAVVTFNKVWATTRVSGSLGVNRLESRFGSQTFTSDGITGTFNLVRDITPNSEFSLYADRRLTDQTNILSLQFEDFNFDLAESAAVEVTAVRAGYNARFSDGSRFTVGVSASRSDYIQTGIREDRSGIDLGYSRPVTELLSWFTDASLQHWRFENDGKEDYLASLAVGLDYQLSARMDIRTSIGHRQKTSEIATREYDENWAVVSLNYQFF